MAYGKLKVDTITYDDSGTDTDVSVSDLAGAGSAAGHERREADAVLRDGAPPQAGRAQGAVHGGCGRQEPDTEGPARSALPAGDGHRPHRGRRRAARTRGRRRRAAA